MHPVRLGRVHYLRATANNFENLQLDNSPPWVYDGVRQSIHEMSNLYSRDE